MRMILEMNSCQKHDDFLEHYGVKGMRWGVRKSREKAKSVFQSKISEYRKKKLQKKRVKTLAKARKTRIANMKKAKRAAERRAKILKNPTKLLRNRDEFTRSEIEDALRGFDMERRLRELSYSQLEAPKRYLDTIFTTMNSGANAYNTVARYYNTFVADKDKKIPYIEQIKQEKKK